MNKVYGLFLEFSYVREERTRIVVSYNLEQLEDGIHATWCEVVFYKKQHPIITLQDIKDAIIGEINTVTEEKIKNGFVWKDNPVWLSLENQSNFATAEHRAVTIGDNLPHKEKIGEQEDGSPIYYTFKTAAELTNFWNACQDYIDACRRAGWELKDSINWNDYKVD